MAFLRSSRNDNFFSGNDSPNRKGPKKAKGKTNFLSEATRKYQYEEKDVGLDIIGVLKDNLENVTNYFDHVRELCCIKGEIQQLQFGDVYPDKEYRMIQMDKELLEEFETTGSLVFRGDASEDIVLCSRNKTYSVVETEVSNTLLPTKAFNIKEDVPDGAKYLAVRKVPMIFHHYLEPKEMVKISNRKLVEILRKAQYEPPVDVPEEDLHTFDELLDMVQMSEGQLKEALDALPVAKMNGVYYWIPLTVRNDLLDKVMYVLDEETDLQDRVTFDQLRAKLSSDIPDDLVHWILHSHFNEIEGEPGVFAASARAFCRTRAMAILLSVVKMPLAELEKQVERRLPCKLLFDIAHLEAMAFVSTSMRHGKVIEYFSIDDLPLVPRERMNMLLERKQDWTLSEVFAFFSDLVTDETALKSMLAKLCTTEVRNGEKVYCGLRAL